MKGAEGNDPNKGGTWRWEGIEVSLTDANHSSSSNELEYLGEPCGLVFKLEDGKRVYFAGDTNAFGDMALIQRLYEPEVAVLPIGDHYTMGPKEAAVALELLGVKRCVPCHFGTFPVLRGTPQELQELAPDVEVHMIEPGDTVDAVRQRWWGATGRRVPEISVEGELPLEEAVVLEGVGNPEILREAHRSGKPVVVRAATAAGAARRARSPGGVGASSCPSRSASCSSST